MKFTMLNYRLFIIPMAIILSLAFIWYLSVLFNNVSNIFSDMATNSDSGLSEKPVGSEIKANINIPSQNTDFRKAVHEKNTQKTIDQLKRELIVTDTISVVLRQESAMTQNEAKPDRLFKPNPEPIGDLNNSDITNTNAASVNQYNSESIDSNMQSQTESSNNTSLDILAGQNGIEAIENTSVDYQQPINNQQDTDINKNEYLQQYDGAQNNNGRN